MNKSGISLTIFNFWNNYKINFFFLPLLRKKKNQVSRYRARPFEVSLIAPIRVVRDECFSDLPRYIYSTYIYISILLHRFLFHRSCSTSMTRIYIYIFRRYEKREKTVRYTIYETRWVFKRVTVYSLKIFFKSLFPPPNLSRVPIDLLSMIFK